ncbi:hypothetical protein V5F34_16745 [Xanthobacter autotrophicus]|uniref:hypothetical protein n=1 Tax=Xanthobacter autotrophicus TaxID=280 RepID=UPI001AEED5B8|nr:hypothetical protein [Xanthobacter autotrophicus]
MASLQSQKMKARLESVGATEKHLAMHNAINGQVFWQSGTAGVSSGQHGMSPAISGMDIAEVAAVAAPLTGAVNGPAMSPTIARIASSLWSQMATFMQRNMS